jgi:hypothetical protein
MPKGENL